LAEVRAAVDEAIRPKFQPPARTVEEQIAAMRDNAILAEPEDTKNSDNNGER
jgi:hypothetical protein